MNINELTNRVAFLMNFNETEVGVRCGFAAMIGHWVPRDRVRLLESHFDRVSAKAGRGMLPEPGVFHFPWEISSVQEGTAVRTYGRLLSYKPEVSEAVLCTQHLSVQYDITVHTAFVEPLLPLLHSHYLVLGDVERTEGDGVMVRARVLNCVDGVDLTLLQRAIMEQRQYFQERDGDAPVQETEP